MNFRLINSTKVRLKVKSQRFEIQNSKFKIPNYEFQIPDYEFQIPYPCFPNNEQRTTNNAYQPSTINYWAGLPKDL